MTPWSRRARLATIKELTLGGADAEFARKLHAEMPKLKLGAKPPAKP